MDYQTVFSILFLLIFTNNYSLALPYLNAMNDISEHQSNENRLQTIFDDDQVSSKWSRQSESNPHRSNSLNKSKSKSRFLKYDFLLHQWRLRKMGQ